MLDYLKKWAKKLKTEILVLYYSCKDPRTPWVAKAFTALVLAYAFSPIDLIPDFIPILGYLDDLILLPLGIFLAIKLIPNNILVDARNKLEENNENKKPQNWYMGAVIIFIWLVIILYLLYALYSITF